MDVHGNDKRWLVTLVTSNKVVAPVLQDIVKQEMDKLYTLLDNGLPTPCSLQTLTYADVCHLAATSSLASSLKGLNFGNINNNSSVHGKTKTAYNYNVNSSVDLAKLYLPDYLAVFSAFDKSMDLSAALRLLGCRKYPIQIFVSSDPLHDIQPLADDVRENVRNRGSHFKESDWTQIFFDQCFDKLKALLQNLPLLPIKKRELLDQLSAWKTEGFKRIVDNDVKDLLEKFQNFKLSSINDKLDDIPTKEENERVIEKLLDRMESLLRKVEHKLDESSVLSTDATSKETRPMREKIVIRMRIVIMGLTITTLLLIVCLIIAFCIASGNNSHIRDCKTHYFYFFKGYCYSERERHKATEEIESFFLYLCCAVFLFIISLAEAILLWYYL